MVKSFGGFQTARNTTFDDTAAQRIDGLDNKKLQDFIDQFDKYQDRDDAGIFRREDIEGIITSLTPAPADGWYLVEDGDAGIAAENNNLVLIESGAIAERILPADNLTIKVDGVRKDWDGAKWEDFKGGSEYFVDPVKEVLTTVPAVTGYSEGDRILISSTPPEIKELESGAWEDTLFPDGATVKLLESDRLYSRKGNGLISYLPPFEPLFFSWGLTQNVAISTFANADNIYGIRLNRVIFPSLRGTIDIANGYFAPTLLEEALVQVCLDFAEHTTEANPDKTVLWRRTQNNGATWETVDILLETKGEEGLFTSTRKVLFEPGWNYQLALSIPGGVTAEDILKVGSIVHIGIYDQATQNAIEQSDVLLQPIISIPIETANGALADISYNLTIVKDLTSLTPKLYDDTGSLIATNTTITTGISAGDTLTTTFTGVAAFDANNVPKDFYLEVDFS